MTPKIFKKCPFCGAADGRLPLLEALKHGCTWEQSVRELHSMHLAMAISKLDDETSLFSFSLAAASSAVVEECFLSLARAPTDDHGRDSRSPPSIGS
jgi:hypothetical protein